MKRAMKRVAIIGAGGHGRVIRDTLSLQKDMEIEGFYDDDPGKLGQVIDGTQVKGPIDCVRQGRLAEAVVVAIGGDNHLRAALFTEMGGLGYELINAIHPFSAISPSVEIGRGFVAMAGALVNAGTRIGDNVCINTGAGIDHDCLLEDHCMIFPHASVAGGVKIGKYSTLGNNAAVNQYLRIGENSFVGAGAVVIKDVPDGAVVAGVPARVLRRMVSHP